MSILVGTMVFPLYVWFGAFGSVALPPLGMCGGHLHIYMPKRFVRPVPGMSWQAEVAPGPDGGQQTMPFDDGDPVWLPCVDDDPEETWLMQMGVEDRWYQLLQEVQAHMETLTKQQRSEIAGQLLRWLAHRAVDTHAGKWLGHMGGRTADLTALLVAMREDDDFDCQVPLGSAHYHWLVGVWQRVQEFVPCHPGSEAERGQPVSRRMPCIMLFSKPLPNSTPPQSEDSDRRVKRIKAVEVEMSSGSGDAPRTSVRLTVPVDPDTNRLDLHLGLMLVEEEEASPATTVAVRPPQEEGETMLETNVTAADMVAVHAVEAGTPVIDRFGLSDDAYRRLWEAWRTGFVSTAEIRRVHGPAVATQVLAAWGPLPVEAYLPGAGLPGETRDPSMPVPGNGGEEEDEVTGMLDLRWFVPIGVLAMQREAVPFFTVAPRVVRHLVRQGANAEVLASVLHQLAWAREEHEYMMMLEEFLGRLELPHACDMERVHDVDPGHRDVINWLESELWLEYLDDYEAQVGWESDGVQSLREQDRVSDADLQVWREWAAAVTEVPVQRAGRSRSPRRVSGDDVSLMGGDGLRPRPKRRPSGASDSRGPRRRRARAAPSSAASGAGRERSTRPSARGADGLDDRCDLPRVRRAAAGRGPREVGEVRHLVSPGPRETREVRHLAPRAPGPMTVMEASAWWMRLMGLRNGFDGDATCVLPRDGYEDRLRDVRAVPVQDVMTVVLALLRVVTMLQVECAQLIMQHGEFSQEVEVEVDDDETMWMQRGIKRSSRVLLQGEEPSPDLLADEREQSDEARGRQAMLEAQEEDRIRQELEQRRQDEEQYAGQVQADASRPLLRTCVVVEHGGAAEGLPPCHWWMGRT